MYHSFVFYCVLLCFIVFYHCILPIDVLFCSAPQPQECLINLRTYLITYSMLTAIIGEH